MVICTTNTHGFLLKHCLFVENAKAAGLRDVGQGTDLLQNASKLGFRSRILFPRQAEGQV